MGQDTGNNVDVEYLQKLLREIGLTNTLAAIIALVILLAIAVVVLVMCVRMARNRNRSKGLWFVLGCVFGWFAVLVLACLPRVEDWCEPKERKGRRERKAQTPKKMQRQYCRCGYCGTVTDEPICPGCGGYLQY
jgi:uncharacterized paraquat-inducible protein A